MNLTHFASGSSDMSSRHKILYFNVMDKNLKRKFHQAQNIIHCAWISDFAEYLGDSDSCTILS